MIHSPITPRSNRGVTLFELCATLSIVGILASVAVPSFANLHRNAARTTAVNDFLHSVYLARSEAIKRGGVVSLCRTADGERCADRTSNWDTGWLVFINSDRDQPADLDPGEEILHRHHGWPGGRITSNRLSFSFRPTTQADVNGTIVFCAARGDTTEARAIIISHTGRPRVSKRDASNRALNCS
jgi:type IV fimbrial biogenesis protein FimT